jgi:hypothetical protein
MTCKDLFALGVRLFGVWLIVRVLTNLESFVDLKLYPSSEKARDSATAYLIYATLDLALAVFFLLWTKVIVAWSYDDEPGIAKEEGAGGKLDEAGGLKNVSGQD